MTQFKREAIVKCVHTFNHNKKSVPCGKKYKVIDRKTAPVQNSVYDKIYTEVTLEAVTEEESENICQTITERTDNLQDKFGY